MRAQELKKKYPGGGGVADGAQGYFGYAESERGTTILSYIYCASALQDRALCAFAPVTLLCEFLNGTLYGGRADFVAIAQGRMLILYFQHRNSPEKQTTEKTSSIVLLKICECKNSKKIVFCKIKERSLIIFN
jgi:hypothetical protein